MREGMMLTTWSRVRTGGLALIVAGAMTPSAYAQAPAQVTFTKDVAPILQKSCQSCHRPGSVAPMSLLT
jgi:mono/diheme cytochrome c family protein